MLRIQESAVAIISGGAISGNKVTGSGDKFGGAISIKSASLTISDGTISGNTVTANSGNSAYGAAVHVSTNGQLKITGGTIRGNSAEGGSAYGGAISIENSSAEISGGSITGNTAHGTKTGHYAYGGAIYVKQSGSLTLSGGTLTGNTAEGSGNYSGSGIYLDATSKVNISGAPIFHVDGENDNTVTLADYDSKKNGDESVYTGNNVRQNIYIAEENEANPQSIVINGDLTGAEGSIWVWAENSVHYEQRRSFAVLEGVEFVETAEVDISNKKFDAEHLKVFRNARDDNTTDNPMDSTPKWLYGTIEGDESGFVYWHGVAGSRKVILRKVDSSYTPVNGKLFTVYKGASGTAYTPKGETLENLPSGTLNTETGEYEGSGCFWIGNLPYGWYIIKENNPETYFYLVVTANGTFGGPDAAGGTTRSNAEAAAKQLYNEKK